MMWRAAKSAVVQDKFGTAACFVCGAPSVSYTGHIHVDDEDVLLGWCKEHERTRANSAYPSPAEPHCTGCFGRIFLKGGAS